MMKKSRPETRAPLYFCILFFSPEVDVGGVAEACLRFTPDLTVRRGERPAVFLEASRCLSLYRPDSLEARIRVLLREWGLEESDYRIARASSLPRAWLCAVEGISEAMIEEAPVSAIRALLDPLASYAEEERKIRILIETLFALGIRRLGGIRKLPPDSATSRFGEIYARLLDELRGGGEEFIWERFRPSEKFIERIDLDPDAVVWDLEPTLFHLKSLIDRTLRRAFGRGKSLVDLEFRIECERRRNRREFFTCTRIRFTFPQSEAGVILRSFREKLGYEFSRKELEAPIVAFELEALELSPRHSLQSDFVDSDQSREGFRELISELGAKLDLEKEVFQVELAPIWRPERSWRKILKEPSEVRSTVFPLPERPLTLFSPPEPLRRLGRYFFHQDRRYAIESFSQIERLSGEWWENDGGFTRTYYRVRVRPATESEEGESHRDFWVFRELLPGGKTGGIFLHGVY